MMESSLTYTYAAYSCEKLTEWWVGAGYSWKSWLDGHESCLSQRTGYADIAARGGGDCSCWICHMGDFSRAACWIAVRVAAAVQMATKIGIA